MLDTRLKFGTQARENSGETERKRGERERDGLEEAVA